MGQIIHLETKLKPSGFMIGMQICQSLMKYPANLQRAILVGLVSMLNNERFYNLYEICEIERNYRDKRNGKTGI